MEAVTSSLTCFDRFLRSQGLRLFQGRMELIELVCYGRYIEKYSGGFAFGSAIMRLLHNSQCEGFVSVATFP